MSFSYDRTRFPLIAIPELRLEIHLLPVTKVQFERFMAEPNEHDSHWYANVLPLNLRASYRNILPEQRERVFMTGVLPKDVLAFTQWIGEGFALPTLDEWRTVYRYMLKQPFGLASSDEMALPAQLILENIRCNPPQKATLADFALMRGGVVEWVRTQSNYWVGLGQPLRRFHPNLLDPLQNEFKPLKEDERLHYFGFRLIRRL